jgi:hypothetical protein
VFDNYRPSVRSSICSSCGTIDASADLHRPPQFFGSAERGIFLRGNIPTQVWSETQRAIFMAQRRRAAPVTAIVIVFLVICWTAAPLLACMIPDRAMTAPEMECCKHMAKMCGSANMPQSHSCCKTEVRPGTTMVVTHNQQVRPTLQVVAALPVPLVRLWLPCGANHRVSAMVSQPA